MAPTRKGIRPARTNASALPMNDLFHTANPATPPLAAEVRPTRLEDVVGQQHILGEKGVLLRRIASGRIGSLILYGPAGVGRPPSLGRSAGR